jgi:hypothetical protein
MLFMEIILWANAELMNITSSGRCSYHWKRVNPAIKHIILTTEYRVDDHQEEYYGPRTRRVPETE